MNPDLYQLFAKMTAILQNLHTLFTAHLESPIHPDSPMRPDSPTLPLQYPPRTLSTELFPFQKGRAFENIPLAPIRHAPFHRTSWDNIPPEPSHHDKIRQIINSTSSLTPHHSDYTFSSSTLETCGYAVQPDGAVPINLEYVTPQQFLHGYAFYIARSTPGIRIAVGTKILSRGGWGSGTPDGSYERVALCCIQKKAGTASIKFGIRLIGTTPFTDYVVVQFEATDVEEMMMKSWARKFMDMIAAWGSCYNVC